MSCLADFFTARRRFEIPFLILLGLLLLSCVALCPIVASAQTNYTSSDQTVDGVSMTPMPGGHDYQHLLGETVNFANGQISYRVQYPMPKGRGISVPYWYGYSSAGLYRMFLQIPQNTLTWTTNDLNFNGSTPLATWQVTLNPQQTIPCGPSMTCFTWPCYQATGLTFYDLAGTNHNVNLYAFAPQGTPPNPPSQYVGQCAQPNAHAAAPASGDGELTAQFTPPSQTINNLSSTGTIGPFTITDKNGTTYFFSGGSAPTLLGGVYVESPTKIEDRNGNIITNTTGYTDTLGRTLSTGFNPYAAQTIGGISYPAPTAPVSAPTSVPVNYSVPNSFAAQPCFITSGVNIGQIAASQQAWSGIALPDGTQYTLFYGTYNPNDATLSNNFGLLNEVVFPNGGWVKYKWSINSSVANENELFPSLGATNNNINIPCNIAYSTPRLAHRYVSYDGVNVAQQQDFTYTTNWGTPGVFSSGAWTSKTTTVVTTDEVVGKHFQTIYHYTPLGLGFGPAAPLEQSIQYFDWTNTTTPIKTVTKAWANIFSLSCEITTVNGLSAGHVYQYLMGADELTDDKQYDYSTATPTSICNGSAGNPARETKISYQTFMSAATPYNPSGQDPGGPFYKLATVQTYDGSSNKLAETDYSYDESVVPLSGILQHDDTNYGTNLTIPGTSFTTRGNATTVTKVCIGCMNSVTKYTYDQTGQLVSAVDACGNTPCTDVTGTNHTTVYAYTDSPAGGNAAGPSNAYVTTITYPQTGTTVHQENFQYNYVFGDLTQSKDENGQPTNYTYADSLDRLTKSALPDGGVTNIAYNDSAATVTTCQLITGSASAGCSPSSPPSGWKTGEILMDGMFHATQKQLPSDPDGADMTDTTFDGLGQPKTASNPHRATGSSTDGITATTRDALGRPTLVTEPDGSAVQSAYDQACTVKTNVLGTLVTDEAGHQRRSCVDGLGRLIEVDEPGGTGGTLSLATPFVTLYNYDVLGNLICVEQHGSASSTGCSAAPTSDPSSLWRVRRFSYDSLSRLLTSENPETGSYPGTISYTYDANGNLVTKTALSPNQASTGTATVITSYSYDTLNRLIGKAYSDADTGNANLTFPVKYGYDGVALTGCPVVAPPGATDTLPVGRRTSMCDGSGGTSWIHDSMGRVLTERRTIGAASGKFIKYAYYSDGSLDTVTTLPLDATTYTYNGTGRPLTAKDNGASINYVTAATYAPPGEIQSMTNGAGIFTAMSYNSRLQPLQMFYGTNTPPALTGSACPATVGNIMHKVYGFGLGSTDNGNVLSITNCRDTTRSESFTYDALNRIASAQSSGTGTTSWGETYTIDAWGNLYSRSGITGKANTEPLSVTATNWNQLTGFNYDTAGNMISNSSIPATYIYDDENRLVWTGGDRYIYDADGDRVEKCVAATASTPCPTSGTNGTLYWRGTGSDTLDESDLAGNAVEEYVFFNGKRIARRDISTSAIFYYFSDHLGSHDVITSAAGVIQRDADYYPYGGEAFVSGSDPNHYKYNGKERDAESGLDNFGARFDTSNLGRFMTPDWAEKPTAVPYANYGNPQSLNLYSYVENNPTTFGDPDGHVPLSWGTGGGYCPDGSDGGCQGNLMRQWSAQWMASAQNTQEQTDPTAPPPPPTPDPAGVRTDPIQQSRTPANGPPDTTVNYPGDKPGTGTDRTYGPDGRAVKDVDTGHDHGAGDPHAHDWDHTGPKPQRGPGRPLTPEEKEQIKKVGQGATAVGVGAAIGYGIHVIITTAPEWAPFVLAF